MFDHCLYFNTTALARRLEREWTAAFKPFGLTPSQGFMLRVVLEKPGLLQSALAKELAISRATATRTLDGLQKMGFLERRSTKEDGRESAIFPAIPAMEIKESLNGSSAEVTRRLKRLLSSTHFEQTVADIRSVRSAME